MSILVEIRGKKESVIEKISSHKEQDKKISKEKKEKMKEVERWIYIVVDYVFLKIKNLDKYWIKIYY